MWQEPLQTNELQSILQLDDYQSLGRFIKTQLICYCNLIGDNFILETACTHPKDMHSVTYAQCTLCLEYW